MDEYDDYYAKDGSGNIYAPDSDSENPDLPDDPDEPYTNNFTDVSEGAYYYDAVLWAVNEGITNGTTENDFQSVCKLHPCSGRHLPVEGSRMPRARIDRLPIRRCSKGQFLLQSRSVGLPGRHHHRCHRRSLPAGSDRHPGPGRYISLALG